MTRVLVVDRKAFASPQFSSRSVSSRILENLSWLAAKSKIKLSLINETELGEVNPSEYDFVVFARHTSAESLEFSIRAKKNGCKIVYEIDDFMPSLPKYIDYNKKCPDLKLERISEHISRADIITVPTSLAKNHIDGHYGVSAVVAPTGLHIEKYFRKSISSEGNSILYTNTDSIKLNRFRENFINTLSEFLISSEREIDIVTDPNPQMNTIPNSINRGNMDWFAHKEFLGSTQFLFAIVPLSGREDPEELTFNECKSQIKFIDYGGLGIPGIYSKTPVYEKYVEDGITGLVVENDSKAWREAMCALETDEKLRNSLKKNAHEKVREDYHVSVTSKVWESFLV